MFEMCHIFKGLISYLHAVILFCIMFMSNDIYCEILQYLLPDQ